MFWVQVATTKRNLKQLEGLIIIDKDRHHTIQVGHPWVQDLPASHMGQAWPLARLG